MRARKGYLYQKTKGGVWYVRTQVAGKPIIRSTGTANRKTAETERTKLMELYCAGDDAAVLRAVAGKLRDTEADVERLEAEANPPPEIGVVWGAFLASPLRPDSGDATLSQYGSEWERFKKWLAEHHPSVKHLHEVTSKTAAEYAADLTAAKVSASTFNQHRGFLRLLWRVLAERARLTTNVWDGITRKKLNALANRKRPLSAGQFDALLLATERDPDLRDLFLVLAWTGQRLADGVLLRWGAVDFARGVITFSPMKTARRMGKQVFVPLFPAAREVLDRREAGHPVRPAAYVFPELVAAYEHDRPAFTERIGKAFERAGMVKTEARADRKRGVTLFGAHSLRHFFVTAAASSGMPSAMIKSITGHGSDGMLEHYQHIGADMAAEIASRMTAKALPAPGAIDAKGDGTPTLQGQIEALRAKVAELAGAMTAKTWRTIKSELETLAKTEGGAA